MTDVTSIPPPRRAASGRRRGTEFYLYFSLIFVFALPFTTLGWVRDIGRYRTLNLQGPLARAWVEADSVTPQIFSA